LRIAFNGQRLAGQRLGVGRYIEYMLRYWSRMLSPSEDVMLFLRRKLSPDDLAYLQLSNQVQPRVLAPDVSGILWENLRLGAASGGCDVLFCPAYTAPLSVRTRLVVATHSVNEIQPAAQSRWYPYTYGKLYRHSATRADKVIVPCETTKNDLANFYQVDASRIEVVEQGSDESFRPIADDEVLSRVRERFFKADRPFVLFVGKASTRRNIPTLLRAFAQLKREKNIPHGLLLFGPNPDGLPLAALCSELGITDSVVQDDGVVRDHSELVEIYNAADVFVHPSEFEGWSMTTVEAMGCGTAVIAVNRGGLGEVARGYAYMIDTPTVDSLADAMHKVLSDDSLRKSLEEKALQRGSSLRWSQTTRRTLDIVRSVATG
jgi:glycosyltransferase involved in cell wall biosynthesis